MSNYQFQIDDLATLIEEYNPFAFKNGRNTIMVFRTYEEAYYELLNRIYKAGPIMVDAVLFAVDTWGMSVADGQRFVELWKNVTGIKDQFFLFDWKHGGKERDDLLERFAKGCHLLSETRFNKDMFLSALSRFKEKMKIED